MYSDIVCEQLVKRTMGIKQILIGVGIAAAGLILAFLLYAVGAYTDHTGLMGSALFLVTLFGAGYLIRMMFVEYEYTFVNGELTVDKIIAKSSRKHLLNLEVKSIEKMGKLDDEAMSKIKADVIKDYSLDPSHEDTVYALYKDSSTNQSVLLIFTPNKKLLGAMKTYVNVLVFREAFPNFKTDPKKVENKA